MLPPDPWPRSPPFLLESSSSNIRNDEHFVSEIRGQRSSCDPRKRERRLTRPSFPPRLSTCPIILGVTTVETEKANLSIIETTNGSRSSSRFEIKISEFRKLFSPGFLKSFSDIFSVIFSMFLSPLGIEYF